MFVFILLDKRIDFLFDYIQTLYINVYEKSVNNNRVIFIIFRQYLLCF